MVEKGAKRYNTFRTGAKMYLSEKNILGLGALNEIKELEKAVEILVYQVMFPQHPVVPNFHSCCYETISL